MLVVNCVVKIYNELKLFSAIRHKKIMYEGISISINKSHSTNKKDQ